MRLKQPAPGNTSRTFDGKPFGRRRKSRRFVRVSSRFAVPAKNAAAARPGAGRVKPGAAAPSTPGVSLFTQVAGPNEGQTTGGAQFPPGGDIATSKDWMVQVVTDLVTMYN